MSYADADDIRCLFMDAVGNGYMRNVHMWSNGYVIRELGVDAKEFKVGENVLVPATAVESVSGKA